jgi:hypothetical protein
MRVVNALFACAGGAGLIPLSEAVNTTKRKNRVKKGMVYSNCHKTSKAIESLSPLKSLLRHGGGAGIP